MQDGTLPPSFWVAQVVPLLFPLLGTILQSKPRQSIGRLPCSAPVDRQQCRTSLGKWYPRMGKDQGCSWAGSYHIAGCLPSPDIPWTLARSNCGSPGGRWQDPGKALGTALESSWQLGVTGRLSLPPLALQQQQQQQGAGSTRPSPQISTGPISASPSAFLIKVIRYSRNT